MFERWVEAVRVAIARFFPIALLERRRATSRATSPQRERAIAQASRAAYDFFLFNPGG